MNRVLITGAQGFIGRNLEAHLAKRDDVEVFAFDVDNDASQLEDWLAEVDLVYHLAGVNRPQRVEEFEVGNVGVTARVCDILRRHGRAPKIVMTSSSQAELENPYGVSKRRAEATLLQFAHDTGSAVSIHRLKNVYGKWCRPNYNSVTATFCHNIAHDLPISISDPATEVELVYVDDVVECLVEEIEASPAVDSYHPPDTVLSHRISLGELAGRIQAMHQFRANLLTPDFSVRFNKCLYATYLSYAPPQVREYGLAVHSDDRGSLAEFIKSQHSGQVFVSRTHPGITRGNHYHHTKAEKFLVVAGEGLVRMRRVDSDVVDAFHVRGQDYRVVDIPPGHAHSIQNVGEAEMVTVFWASEVFDPDRPDTYYEEV